MDRLVPERTPKPAGCADSTTVGRGSSVAASVDSEHPTGERPFVTERSRGPVRRTYT